jgi:hypothetical protein
VNTANVGIWQGKAQIFIQVIPGVDYSTIRMRTLLIDMFDGMVKHWNFMKRYDCHWVYFGVKEHMAYATATH